MKLTVELDTGAASRLLADIGDPLERSYGLMSVLADSLADYEREVFATRGHGQWAPLHPVTIAQKGSNRPLVNTGSLLANLTDVDVVGDSVKVDGGPVAGYMRRGARGIPKRDPAPAPDRGDVDTFATTLLDALIPRR